ncbi:LysR family transcriptional regulator [Roseibium limicola]|uniref:LysR family transcriptional regulator n=1 Tax=Roseibium limicola TaxID=2816037 RepID=A0A939J7W9_9HYPH|nr:LysR family transcriptional regulator [Roseibium limicola]
MEWLKSVKVFTSVVEYGSLSAAGRQLGLSPASVSRHINDLENGLGIRLLNRTSRRLSLTEAGQLYCDKVENILGQIDEAERSVVQLHTVPRGTLRVHSRMVFGHQYLVPSLKKFFDKYPEIKIDLQMSNFPVDIIAQGIDIDIRMGKLEDSSLVARKLANSDRILVASPSYLAASGVAEKPEDLYEHSCLTYRLNMGMPVWRFRKDGQADTEIPVQGCFQSDNGQAILRAALDGLGIAMMNEWSVQKHLKDGSLVHIFDDYKVSFSEFENGVYAVFQKSRHLPLKIRLFIDFITEEFRELLQ